ncbi:hypothetical protein EJ075_16515 [Mesorhizobium sp. M6A.T.Cr.TU.016.01.1.1]|nr:hypothetical protein EJ075_16515 [Mesorhizobium sp. M6A.T.Cr.TU.016.01.1.1]
MTTAKPLARYSAIEGALASGFATAELHHLGDVEIKMIRNLTTQHADLFCPGVRRDVERAKLAVPPAHGGDGQGF